jgi:hypothetical protein
MLYREGMPAPVSTILDQLALQEARAARDPAIGLRVWGTNVGREWSWWDGTRPLTIGRDPSSTVFLSHPEVARCHATIEWRGPELWMLPASATAILRVDGIPQPAVRLIAGTLVQVGPVMLVVSSTGSDLLRRGFTRFLGYSEAAQEQVDTALYAAIRRSSRHLAIKCPAGAGGVALARFVHNATGPGVAWPFVEATPKLLTDLPGTLRQAQLGTLAVRAENLTGQTASALVDAIERNHHKLRLVVLMQPEQEIESVLGGRIRDRFVTIAVAPLEARRSDLAQLITETATYYAGTLGATTPLLTVEDFAAIHRQASEDEASHDAIDSLIEKVVAVRQLGIKGASIRLKCDPTGLKRLLERNGIALPVEEPAAARAARR